MPSCRTCKEIKDLEKFPKNSTYKSGRASICKSCAASKTDQYRHNNYELVYANKYNTTIEVIRELFQRTVCDVCSEPETRRRLSIDHCHTTGQIRGMLCDACNTGLGKFRDSQELLYKASTYLWRAEQNYMDKLKNAN